MSKGPENRLEDPRVSDAYRDLADEHAPEPLNRKILVMAARAGTPYARARAWMRPAAWAATIALSFAFVLELTQLPSNETVIDGLSHTMRGDETGPAVGRELRSTEEFLPRDAALIQEAEEQARRQAGTNQRPVPLEADDDVGEQRVADESMALQRAAARREATDRLAADHVAAEARGAAASFAARSDAVAGEAACAASLRETPQAWLDCIRELRESGNEEQADREYEEFRQVFPEFDDSGTDK